MDERAVAQAVRDVDHLRTRLEDLESAMNTLYDKAWKVWDVMKDNHQTTNLKLHDIAEEADDRDFGSYFNGFCTYHLEAFDVYLESQGLRKDYVGTTSSFYIVDASPASVKYEESVHDLIETLTEIHGFPECMPYGSASEYYRHLCDDVYNVSQYGADRFEDVNLARLDDDRLYDFLEAASDAASDIGNQIEMVEGSAVKTLGDIADVEDVVHDAYMHVWAFKDRQLAYWNEYLAEMKEQ